MMEEVKKYREVGNTLIFQSTSDPDKAFDFRKQWLACLKLAEIENFRWHDMRHDTASTLARDGKTLKEIAERGDQSGPLCAGGAGATGSTG
jgi:integrase